MNYITEKRCIFVFNFPFRLIRRCSTIQQFFDAILNAWKIRQGCNGHFQHRGAAGNLHEIWCPWTGICSVFAMEIRSMVTAEQPVRFLLSLPPQSGPLGTHPTLVLTAKGLPPWLFTGSDGSIATDALISMSESVLWSSVSPKYSHWGYWAWSQARIFVWTHRATQWSHSCPNQRTAKPDITWQSKVFSWTFFLNRMRVLCPLKFSLWARLHKLATPCHLFETSFGHGQRKRCRCSWPLCDHMSGGPWLLTYPWFSWLVLLVLGMFLYPDT